MSSTLTEIEEAIHQVRRRRQLLVHLHSLLDKFCDPEEEEEEPDYPILPLPLDDLSTCSRRTRTESPFPFTPTISERSRKLAARRPRQPVYHKIATPRSSQAQVQSVQATHTSAVTDAIVAKIKQNYGSLDSYHRQRRETALSYKDFPNKQEAELRECTFQPHIEKTRIPIHPPRAKIGGLDEFVKRQAKARELKAVTVEEKKPGSGSMYTGKPTKVEPFMLGKRAQQTSIRE